MLRVGMDAPFTQHRTDARSHRHPAPTIIPCFPHNCTIRLFGDCSEGTTSALKRKGSPSVRMTSLSLLTHGHRAGGRIRDYPSQKDPIPEVTLQRVPRCAAPRRETKSSQPVHTEPRAASCRAGSASSGNGPTPRPRPCSLMVLRKANPKGGLMLGNILSPAIRARSARSILAHARCTSSGHDPIIDPITHYNSWGVPSFPGRTPCHNQLLPTGRLALSRSFEPATSM